MSSQLKKLLHIPHTDVGKLQYISQRFATTQHVKFVAQREFSECLNSDASTQTLGVWLIEPAQRLIASYNAEKKTNSGFTCSFREYYSNPVRVNLYHKLLGSGNIGEFGYIGIQQDFYQSILLFADWQNTDLYRLPYSVDCQRSTDIEIPADEYAEILQLYAVDYSIYEQARAECCNRWQQYKHNHHLPIAQGKRVIIHLGPPKTGTSAIQSWLNGNRSDLAGDGIYYPSHNSDANGVSSGNFERLVSYDQHQSKFYFDSVKASALVEEFNASEYHTLLLSSEHFYYYLIWFFSRFSAAKYIFYIRHPLAVAESSFHQQVKRHSRTKDFIIPPNIGFDNLKLVSQVADNFGCHVDYRFFSQKLYEGGSLLSDFGASIGTTLQAPAKVKRLNSQYSPGAIMLMRMCNSFADQSLKRDLDMHLQKYSEDVPAFSFVSDEERKDVTKKIHTDMDSFVKRHPSIDKKSLEYLIDGYDGPPQFNAKMRDEALTHTLKELASKDKVLTANLYKQARCSLKNDDAREILSRLNITKAIKIKYKFQLLVEDARAKLLGQLKNLFN